RASTSSGGTRESLAPDAPPAGQLPRQRPWLLVALDLPRAVRALARRRPPRQRPAAARASRRPLLRPGAARLSRDGLRGPAADGGGVPRPVRATAHRGARMDPVAAGALPVRHDRLAAAGHRAGRALDAPLAWHRRPGARSARATRLWLPHLRPLRSGADGGELA